ncbi:MAG: hypothetical protein AAFW59_07315 [Pseudomonadota bacterium]
MQAVDKSRFLVIAGLVMILYAATAFAAVSLVQPARFESFVKPLALVHMVAGMGWLVLFFSQARLAHRGEIARHRNRMNVAIAVVAVLSVTSIIIVYQVGFAARVLGESRDALGFAILFAFALRQAHKGDIESHKRLMLIASLNLINPANMRVPIIFDWPPPTSLPITLTCWVAVPIAHDLITQRKVHRATAYGVGFTLITFAIVVAVIFSPLMPVIETWLYGPGGNFAPGLTRS